MLLIKRLSSRVQSGDDTGVALVLVVFVMLVGVIAAATIAAAIFFVIGGNVTNKGNTQAFVAAESGRDKVVAALTAANAAGTCTTATMSASTVGAASAPYFSSQAQSITVAAGGSAPSTWNTAVAPACPTKDTSYIVIKSTGYGTSSTSGPKTTTVTVYSWQVVPHTSQSGTMAGTNGSFHGVGGGSSSSNIRGDLVVRDSDFTCSGSTYIDGDLWVLGGSDGTSPGNVTITGGCQVTGSIYAAGTVSSNGGNSTSPIIVGKSILAGGGVTMDSNGVSIGAACTASDESTCGRITSGGLLKLTGTGGNAAVGSTTVPHPPLTGTSVTAPSSNWKYKDGTAVTVSVGATPTFNPPLNSSQNGGSTAGTVYAMTNWIEFGATTVWQGSPVAATILTCPSNPNTALSSATRPVILDYTGSSCSATSGNTTTITLTGGNVPQDAVVLIAPGNTMKVKITGALTGPSSPTSQLFFVHQSLNTGNVTNDCGLHGVGAGDSFTVGSGTIAPRIMVYTPCGLNGTWTGSLTGQLYVGGSMTYNGSFTCQPMSWIPTPSPMPNMDCKILGSGGAAGTTTYTQSLGGFTSQAEQ